MEEKLNIYQKLLEVKKRVPYIKKDKDGHNYRYATPSAVLGALNPILNEYGLILKTEIISVEKERIFLKPKMVDLWVNGAKVQERVEVFETLYGLNMKMTWVDTETGDKDENLWFSSGVNGDEKGVGSANTYGERYFMLKYFNIPTDDDDADAFQTKHMTQDEIAKKEAQLLLKFNESVKLAIHSFTKAESIDELKELKGSFEEAVIKHPDVILAAKRTFESLSKGIVPEKPTESTEANPEGLLKKDAEKVEPIEPKVEEPKIEEKPVDPEMEQLLAKYIEIFGVKPHHKASKETIMNKIEEYHAEQEAKANPIPQIDLSTEVEEAQVEEIVENKKDDEFLTEMNDMKVEETVETTEEAKVVEIPYLAQLIKAGKAFTVKSSMVAWWNGNKEVFKERLTPEELNELSAEFKKHYDSINE